MEFFDARTNYEIDSFFFLNKYLAVIMYTCDLVELLFEVNARAYLSCPT